MVRQHHCLRWLQQVLPPWRRFFICRPSPNRRQCHQQPHWKRQQHQQRKQRQRSSQGKRNRPRWCRQRRKERSLRQRQRRSSSIQPASHGSRCGRRFGRPGSLSAFTTPSQRYPDTPLFSRNVHANGWEVMLAGRDAVSGLDHSWQHLYFPAWGSIPAASPSA